jgi:hypothetical protein
MAETRTGLQTFSHRPASGSNYENHSDTMPFGQVKSSSVRMRIISLI